MASSSDQEIRIHIKLVTEDLLARIEAAKQAILAISTAAKTSFAVAAQSLRESSLSIAEDTVAIKLALQALNVEGRQMTAERKQWAINETENTKQIISAQKEAAKIQQINAKQITAERKQAALVQIELEKQVANAEKEHARSRATEIKQLEAQQKQRVLLEKENAKQIINAQQEYVKSVLSGNTAMSLAAQQQGQHLQNLAAQIKQVAAQTKQSYQQIVNSMVSAGQIPAGTGTALLQLLKQGTPAASGFAAALGALGSSAERLFGIFTGYQILRSIIDKLKEAAVSAYEFTKATFSMGVAINVLQRSGIVITLDDIYESIDKLQNKFGVFSKKELIEGSAQLLNLVRDFGLTKDQIVLLQDSIATLAVVNGRAMDDVQRTVALALSSGYTEGLQRLGVSINRVTIAMEAGRLGYGKNYMSLTELQRAEATYNLILQKTAKYQEDLAEYQKTAPGQIDKATASFKDLGVAMGELVLPAWAEFVSKLGEAANGLREVIELLKQAQPLTQEDITRRGGIWNPGGKLGTIPATEYPTLSELEGDKIEKVRQERFRIEQGLREKEQAMLEQLSMELGEKLLEIEEKWNERRKDAYEDFTEDIEDIALDHARKMEDLERDLQQKLADINADRDRKRADAYRDYHDGLIDIGIWYTNEIADINQKYRDNELDAEKDFQRKLLELKEEFIFDMESAAQKRDARAALELIRRYNLDKRQLERKHDEEQDDLHDQLQRELAELRRQRDIKLRDLRIELQRKLAEINLEYQRELEALNIWKQRELEDIAIWRKREEDDANDHYRRMLEDADKYRKQQLEKEVSAILKKQKLDAAALQNLFKLTEAYVGKNGVMTQLWNNYFNFLKAGGGIVPSLPGSIYPPTTPTPSSGGFAAGGTVLAKQPSMLLFGERGAEYATLTPANKINTGVGNGKMTIALSLSPDLQARIVDDALDQFANVIVEVHKERRR